MLSFRGPTSPLCEGITRREWLRVGGLSACGLSVPNLLHGKAEAASVDAPVGKAKSCILLFFLGGPPQHETWDPKPDAPVEIRGDFQPIATNVPGIHVGECMPKTARLLDKIAILRAVSSGDSAHSTSGYAMSTGTPHIPLGVEGAKPGAPNNWPCLGGVVRKLIPDRGVLPTAISLPEIAANDGGFTWPGQDAGFLGRPFDPWQLECDPTAEDFQIRELKLAAEMAGPRFETRHQLLQDLDRTLETRNDDPLAGFRQWHAKGLELLRSPEARNAFDLTRESPGMRDRYGRTRFGQSVLLARRMVEAGVPLIQVNWTRLANAPNNGHWDTHAQNAVALRNHLMPVMDQTYSALLEDLAERELLDETLIVWTGEFGRTPKINANGGRDHWGNVYSVAMAGGGVKGGQVFGKSDRHGGEPIEGKVSPADISATIFHSLGLAPQREIHDQTGRPLPISRGEVIRAIL